MFQFLCRSACYYASVSQKVKLHTENNACMLFASLACWARLYNWTALTKLRRRSLWIIRKTDDRWILASREISLTVRWIWGLSSSLITSDSTVSTFSSVRALPLPGRLSTVPKSELCQIQQPAECCSSSNLYPETLLETAERCNLYIHTDFKIFSSTELRHVERQCDA